MIIHTSKAKYFLSFSYGDAVRGGRVTEAGIWKSDPDGDKSYRGLVQGFALCSPEDQFIKSVGRRISLDRALDMMCMSDEEKEEFIEEYRKTVRYCPDSLTAQNEDDKPYFDDSIVELIDILHDITHGCSFYDGEED